MQIKQGRAEKKEYTERCFPGQVKRLILIHLDETVEDKGIGCTV